MLYRLTESQWWNRYWRLGRKIESQGGRPSPNDVRMAAILRTYADRGSMPGQSATIRSAADSMEWVIDYGRRTFYQALDAAKAEARVGSPSGG